MANSLLAGLSLLYLPFLPTSKAFSWSFVHAPQQCANLSIVVNGTDGKPPYRVLIIPFGPTPLPNAIEARKIMDVAFPGTDNEVEFTLGYPANSQLVAVVSDATGFGSGGTSVAAQVLSSSDGSCFNATTNVAPPFYFSIDPPNQIVQCQNTRIYWTPSDVVGTPSFQGVIPGGQSFAIPYGSSSLTNVSNLGTGFTWQPSLRSGTTLILVAGDDRGNGTGGSILNVVSAGTNQDGSCLSNTSPSSTPGSPAGGSYPTGGGGWVGASPSNNSSNTGMILGIVLGVIAALVASICLFWFFYRRRKQDRRAKERPVNLMYADDDDDDRDDLRNGGQELGGRAPSRLNELPEFYQPEPFMVPDPTRVSADGRTTFTSRSTHTGMEELDGQRPLSGVSTSMYTRVTTPDFYGSVTGDTVLSGSSTHAQSGRRKGGAPRPMRPVNVIQHDDAGPSPIPEGAGESETIELPPAYTALKGAAHGARPDGE